MAQIIGKWIMVYRLMVSGLEDFMQMLHTKRQNSDDDTEKRHISVVYTEIEKVKAYIETYLIPKESVE